MYSMTMLSQRQVPSMRFGEGNNNLSPTSYGFRTFARLHNVIRHEAVQVA